MRKFHNLLILTLTITLWACAPTQVNQSRALSHAIYYLQPAHLDIPQVPPAPAPGSETDKADFALLHEWQNKRTEAQCAVAKAESHAYYEEFFGGISPFASPLPAEAADFFKRIRNDTDAAVRNIKNLYQRPRPFHRDPGLNPCLGKINGLSYPSGHAAISRLFALIIADLVPERRSEFLARADQAALNRVIGGVHHPSDIEAGKLAADALYAEFLKNPAFNTDIESLRRHLR